MTTTARVHRNPYVGPQSFRRGDALYGRDREVGDLLDLLIAERVVLLHSPSGAGKTSLIQARLLSMLEDEGFEVLPVIRLTHDVPATLAQRKPPVNRYVLSALLSLEEGVPSRLQHSLEELADLTLAQYIAEWPDLDNRPGNEVLVFDQFEEVITADPVDHEAKTAFFADLGATLRDRSLWALFSMREDFVAELDPYARHVPTRFSTRFRLDLLTVDQALEAVTLPARDAGVEFDAAAAVKLVDDLRRVRTQRGAEVVEELGRHVEPVQLQVTCRQIWEGLGDAGRIGIDDIESAGDVNEALAGYYATSVAAVSQETGVPERALRDWFEQELVTAQGFRGQVLGGPDAAADADGRVLELLTAAHLLRAESRRGAIWYELAHDRLTQPIEQDNARWRAEHLSDIERRASEWEREGRPDRLLIRGPDLDHAQGWASQPTSSPTRVERDYLEASVKAQRQRDDLVREAVRTRRWLRLSIALLVLAVVTAALAVVSAVRASRESDHANQAALRAAQNALVADGLGELSFDSQLSILLTLRALTSGTPEKKADVWEVSNVLQLALNMSPVAHTLGEQGSPAVAASWSPDGDRVAVADKDGTVRLVDAETGRVLAERQAVGEVKALAVGPQGADPVALGLANGSVEVWDSTGDAAPVATTAHGGNVYDVAFSPDGRLLASVGADGAVTVSRLPGDRIARSFHRPVEVNAVAWSRDGTRVLAVDDSGALTGWDVATGRVVVREPSRHSAIAVAVDVSDDGTMIATGGWDGRTVISRLDRRAAPVVAQTPSGGQVASVSFTSDGAHVLSLDQFGTLDVVDSATGRSAGMLTSQGQTPIRVEASPTDPALAVAATGDSDAAVWNTELGHEQDVVVSLGTDRAGRVMTAGYRDDSVLLWSPTGTQVLRRLELTGSRIQGAVIDPSGRYVVHVDTDRRARLTPLGAQGRELILGRGIEALDVSSSGDLVATAGRDSDVRVWSSRTGKLVALLPDHTDTVMDLDFGPADDELVSVSLDGTAIVWDLAQRARRATIRSEGGDRITTAEWGPDHVVAVGWESGTVQLRDDRTGELLDTLEWHSKRVNDLAFDPEGTRLASAGDDGYAVIWDVQTGEVDRAVKHSSWVYRTTFSKDGNHLLISGDGGKPLTVWLDLDDLSEIARSRTTRDLTSAECRRYVPEEKECPAS